MFCHKCGQADQSPETYCRQCGTFLTDPSKPPKKVISPQEHVTANLVLSVMTIVASFTLSALIFLIIGFRDTHPLIYATAGLLIAMGFWHLQALWRTLQLRKHFKKHEQVQTASLEGSPITGKLLEEPGVENIVPASVTESTTRQLAANKQTSTQAKH